MPATPPSVVQPYLMDSGAIDNQGGQRVVFSRQIQFGLTAWLQFRFAENTHLPKGSFLRITSMLDKDWQHHDAETLAEWDMNSAGFNGGSVLVELIAGPGTVGNRVHLTEVTRGLDKPAAWPESPCGTDNRVQTGNSDKRQGRLWVGCTGWLYGQCDATKDLMMTAGHCTTTSTRIMEFNVPNSTSNGTVVRASVVNQYPYTQVSLSNAGVGNDWMVCTVGRNSNTRQTPTVANGGVWYSLGSVPTSTTGQNIRITGYGVYPATGQRNFRSQTQQTNVGPMATGTSTIVRYRTDSSGGNSGGPVIHENTGRVIGIHTHAGCTATGGANQGTRIDLAALVAARGRISCTQVTATSAPFGWGCAGSGTSYGQSLCGGVNTRGGTGITTTAPNEYAYRFTTSAAITLCSFEALTRSTNNRIVTVNTALYAASGSTPARTPITTGKMSIGPTSRFYKSTMSASLPAGTYYVAIDHSALTTTLAGVTAGSTSPVFWRRPPMGTGAWATTGLVPRPAIRVNCCCSSIITARNSAGGTLAKTTAPNEYAYVASVSSTTRICGFSIYSASTSTTSRNVRTRIYGSTSTGAPGAVLASGSVTIGSTPGFYRSNLSATVPAGRFFIAVDHSAGTTYLANLSTGTAYSAPTAYWRRPFGTGSWATTGLVPRPSYRVYYQPILSRAVPQIDRIGRPVSGSTYRVTLSDARPNAPATLLFGVSSSRWGAVPLPFDMGLLGFKGCNLWVSADIYLPNRANSVGAATQIFPMLKDPAFWGLTFYNQWYVLDAGAPAGIAFSDALSSTVGNR